MADGEKVEGSSYICHLWCCVLQYGVTSTTQQEREGRKGGKREEGSRLSCCLEERRACMCPPAACPAPQYVERRLDDLGHSGRGGAAGGEGVLRAGVYPGLQRPQA
jgi:hypothetical protein